MPYYFVAFYASILTTGIIVGVIASGIGLAHSAWRVLTGRKEPSRHP